VRFKKIFSSPSTVFNTPSFIARGVFVLAFVLGFANSSLAQILTPQGRLTLVSNTPVLTSDVVGASTVYYTPYIGDAIPEATGDPVGTGFDNTTFSQLTLSLNSAYQTAGNIYDIFVLANGTPFICAADPAWPSSTSRGTGAGTTQLTQLLGIWVNANTISYCYNGTTRSQFAAGYGVYVGSIYMTANGATTFNIKPAATAGGTNNVVGMWNAYNRVPLKTISRDSSGYTYSTSNAWRPADGSNSNRISMVDGLGQSSVVATLINNVGMNVAQSQVYMGINQDAAGTTAPELISLTAAPTSALGGNYTMLSSQDAFSPALGFHYYQAMENLFGASTTATFNAIGNNQSLILDTEY
jgi:hypothetical protein